jgi:hypothetical protein
MTTWYYTFQSTVDWRQFGFASDAASLPQELAPWRPAWQDDLEPNVDISKPWVLLAVSEAISANGYCVIRADPPNVVRVEFPRRRKG